MHNNPGEEGGEVRVCRAAVGHESATYGSFFLARSDDAIIGRLPDTPPSFADRHLQWLSF
jgi:hypothetical protein